MPIDLSGWPPPLQQQDYLRYHRWSPAPVGPSVGSWTVTASVAPLQVITDPVLDMKVLVIIDSGIQVGGVDYPDGVNQMILAIWTSWGSPYDIYDVNSRRCLHNASVTDAISWDSVNHGYYYAIFVITSDVWWPDYPRPIAGERLMIQGIRAQLRHTPGDMVRLSLRLPQYGLDPLGRSRPACDSELTTTLTIRWTGVPSTTSGRIFSCRSPVRPPTWAPLPRGCRHTAARHSRDPATHLHDNNRR